MIVAPALFTPDPALFAAYAHAHHSTAEQMTAERFRVSHYLRWVANQRFAFSGTMDGEVLEDDAPFLAWLAAKNPPVVAR